MKKKIFLLAFVCFFLLVLSSPVFSYEGFQVFGGPDQIYLWIGGGWTEQTTESTNYFLLRDFSGLMGSSYGDISISNWNSVCGDFNTQGICWGIDDGKKRSLFLQEEKHSSLSSSFFNAYSIEDFFIENNNPKNFSQSFLPTDSFAFSDIYGGSVGAVVGNYFYVLEDSYSLNLKPYLTLSQGANQINDDSDYTDGFLSVFIYKYSDKDGFVLEDSYSLKAAYAARYDNPSTTAPFTSTSDYPETLAYLNATLDSGIYAVIIFAEMDADDGAAGTIMQYGSDVVFHIPGYLSLPNKNMNYSDIYTPVNKNICEDYGYQWLPSTSSENGVVSDYYCCGYDYNTDGSTYSRGGYVCNMSSHEWKSEAEYCSDVTGSDSTFCHNTDIQKYGDDINKGVEEILDGSDGCCGDDQFLTSDEGGDLGYVGTSISSGEDGDQRYLCANDSLYGLIDSGLADKYQYTLWNDMVYGDDFDSAWRWWDAQEGPNSFKIHTIEDVDYIANGQEWFYCNATGANRPTGIAIADGENFSFSSTANEGFPCTNPLNALAPLFAEGGACQGVLVDDINFFFDTDSSANFYCDSSATFLFEDNFEGFESVCYEGTQDVDCKVKKSVLNPEMVGVFTSISAFVDEIDDAQCKANITQQLCVALNGDGVFCETPSLVFGEADDGSTDFQEKSFCGTNLENCLTESGSYEGSCSDIDFQRDEIFYTGHLVDSSRYCLSGDYAQTSETLAGNVVCCIAQATITDPEYISAPLPVLDEGEDLDEESCSYILGDFISSDVTSSYVCSGTIVGNTCCLANTGWQPNFQALALGDLTLPEAFICYSHSGQARISECCTDYTTCNNNVDISLFSENDLNQNNLGFYGKGGTLHTLKNFDEFNNGVLKDMVAIQSKTDSGFYFSFSPKKNLLYEQQTNLETFDYLEFDIAFNTDNFASYTSAFLVDADSNTCSLGRLSTSLLNGQSPMRWHHAMFNLPSSCPSDFDMSLVQGISFITTEGGDATIAVDNFFVSEDDSEETTNTPTYYCTGNFGSWISNLDGPEDKGNAGWFGEDFNADLIEQTGEYWYACEAQASFDWTGRACCGDDTHLPFTLAGNQAGGEYWADAKGGCFHGNPIMNDEVVGERLNEDKYNNILFFNQTFLVCGDETYNLKESFNGITFDTDSSLIENTINPLTVRGTHICSDYGEWIPVSEYPAATIMLSSLYDLTIKNSNAQEIERYSFDLVCEDITALIPETIRLEETLHAGDITSDNVTTFCTLTLYDEDDDASSLIALSHNPDNSIEEFLDSIRPHMLATSLDLKNWEPNEDDKDIVKWCNAVEQSTTTDETFYQPCDSVNDVDIRFSYNPDFNILLIAQGLTSENDFNGIFAQDVGFFNSLWQGFKDILKDWFTSSSGAHDTGIFDAQTTLPITINDADFEVFAMRSRGQKQIIALEEGVQQDVDNLEQLVVEYRNFPDIKQTIEPFIGLGESSDFIAQSFITGNDNTQQITILFDADTNRPEEGAPVAQNVYGEYMDFWPDFSWKYLALVPDFTSEDDEDYSTLFTSTSNNGVLELGEYCEEINEEIVYRYTNQTCEFWNATHPYGTVRCNLQTSQLNHEYCSEDPFLDVDFVDDVADESSEDDDALSEDSAVAQKI